MKKVGLLMAGAVVGATCLAMVGCQPTEEKKVVQPAAAKVVQPAAKVEEKAAAKVVQPAAKVEEKAVEAPVVTEKKAEEQPEAMKPEDQPAP